VFPITANKRTLGVYNLLFDTPREISARERRMLVTLGQHLGVAIENQRLAARERQAAIYEERNLLAQELHDSIAQSLAFLNIEAQLLTSSLAQGQAERATQELACIREGIQQSCDDVRELLLHFRARPQRAELAEAITASLRRFQEHTGIEATCETRGSGMPLDPDLQVQALHIIQECLSNVRKHAHAAHVHVVMERGPVWRLEIRDDGCGFDPNAAQSEQHVGLHIMRERARRIGGELHIESSPGRGTRVRLRVGTAQREAA
jgi:two-component system nitrate/nitrite sensor histidine kinase NarX